MINDLYSLTNMMFFPYHSWIDIQIEMKLRMCQKDPQQAFDLEARMDAITSREQLFDPLLNPQSNKVQFGAYPII